MPVGIDIAPSLLWKKFLNVDKRRDDTYLKEDVISYAPNFHRKLMVAIAVIQRATTTWFLISLSKYVSPFLNYLFEHFSLLSLMTDPVS